MTVTIIIVIVIIITLFSCVEDCLPCYERVSESDDYLCYVWDDPAFCPMVESCPVVRV